MRRKSIIRRAIAAVLLIEALCALILVATALWHERRIRLRALDVTLEGRADSLVGAVQDAEDPQDSVKVDPAEFNPPATDVYAVYNETGQMIGSSPSAARTVVAHGQDGFRIARNEGHQYRVLQRHAIRIIDRDENKGVGLRRPVTILYATRMDHMWSEVLESASFYVVMSIGLLGITAFALVVLLGRLLHPLSELAVKAAGVKTNLLTFQPPDSALGLRELAPLAEALSATIARLRLAFETEHRFMSDASHELKTAVAVVRSTVQVLEMRVRTPEEYRRGLNQVLSDNERVEELISRMLTLARFEERLDLSLSRVNLCQEVQHALEKLGSYAEERGVLLRSFLEKDAEVNLPLEAAQVLAFNLIMNAIQHSPKGSEVLVSVCVKDSGERPAVLTVQDFGSGIAQQNLSRVFDRFFREDPSRSRETGGVGLGLAICKSIAEGVDGVIGVQSVLGEGTVVTASFRLA